ncbi:MAG: hypothetical protein KDK24_16415 [Pseudooceanicola sp.]|nr:hypothetical protein [Pseudooceanicola sp.]
MLSTFGEIATRLRGQLDLTDEEYAALIGATVDEVTELEEMRAPISREMVGRISRVLGLQPGSGPAQALADAAAESNRRRGEARRYLGDDRLMALLARHGGELSDTVKAQINRIIAEEIAGKSRAPDSPAPAKRANPRLSPARLAELVLLSEEVRARFATPDERLSATTLLEMAAEQEGGLQVELLTQMPLFAPDACAVTAGRTLFVETGFWTDCASGARNVGNHILLHEYAHHILHGDQPGAREDGFLPPHALALQTMGDAREAVAVGSYDSADSLELEADFFAVLLAVPWAKLAEVAVEDYKARYLVRKLARDYGAFWPVMDRLVRYMRMDVARDRIREALYRQNRIDHPFLLLI